MKKISTIYWIKYVVNAVIPNFSIVISDVEQPLIAGKNIISGIPTIDSNQMFNIANVQDFTTSVKSKFNDFYSSREISL